MCFVSFGVKPIATIINQGHREVIFGADVHLPLTKIQFLCTTCVKRIYYTDPPVLTFPLTVIADNHKHWKACLIGFLRLISHILTNPIALQAEHRVRLQKCWLVVLDASFSHDIHICNHGHFIMCGYIIHWSSHISTLVMFFHYWILLPSPGFKDVWHHWAQTLAKAKCQVSWKAVWYIVCRFCTNKKTNKQTTKPHFLDNKNCPKI